MTSFVGYMNNAVIKFPINFNFYFAHTYCRTKFNIISKWFYVFIQSKERLIASLREGSGASGESAGVSNLEYDSVKQERDMFREDLQHSKLTADNLRIELQVNKELKGLSGES